jgi:hypothetical protein
MCSGTLVSVEISIDTTTLPLMDSDILGYLFALIVVDPYGRAIQVILCSFLNSSSSFIFQQIGGYDKAIFWFNSFTMNWPDTWYLADSLLLNSTRDVSPAKLSSFAPETASVRRALSNDDSFQSRRKQAKVSSKRATESLTVDAAPNPLANGLWNILGAFGYDDM